MIFSRVGWIHFQSCSPVNCATPQILLRQPPLLNEMRQHRCERPAEKAIEKRFTFHRDALPLGHQRFVNIDPPARFIIEHLLLDEAREQGRTVFGCQLGSSAASRSMISEAVMGCFAQMARITSHSVPVIFGAWFHHAIAYSCNPHQDYTCSRNCQAIFFEGKIGQTASGGA